jgi:Glutathione-dependent formaldehyde-activating enzyme
MIEADRVTLLAALPMLVDTPSESGSGQRIARCPKCSVAVWSHYASAGPWISFIRVGTLDNPDLLPPDIHIFTASKQPWVVLPAGMPAVAEYYERERHWPPASLAGQPGARSTHPGLPGRQDRWRLTMLPAPDGQNGV